MDHLFQERKGVKNLHTHIQNIPDFVRTEPTQNWVIEQMSNLIEIYSKFNENWVIFIKILMTISQIWQMPHLQLFVVVWIYNYACTLKITQFPSNTISDFCEFLLKFYKID